MKSNILILCDTEEEYAGYMTAYLKAQKGVPWEIHTYTDPLKAAEYAALHGAQLIVAAERAYVEELRRIENIRKILLNESGVIRYAGVRNVNKYQPAQEVYKEILSEYMEVPGEVYQKLVPRSDTKLIGFFTPVHRSLQTTFSLALGQMLAVKERTLYLNFEQYTGIPELTADVGCRDLADLIYFLNTDKERFLLRMQTMVLKKGQMDYIPPARGAVNLLEVQAHEWLEMLQRIADSGDYDYIVLDLSESVQGIFDVLRLCNKVYTLTKDDRSARGKIAQYERLLTSMEYEDVLAKSSRYQIPRIRKIPEEIELLTKGELADYVRRIVEEVMD